jgi:hypothetical protein
VELIADALRGRPVAKAMGARQVRIKKKYFTMFDFFFNGVGFFFTLG